MRILRALLTASLVVAAVAVLALFYVQNEQTRVTLFLNVGAWAGRTAAPVPVPLLVLGSAGAGALLVGAFTAYEVVVLEVRHRRTHRLLRRAQAELDAARGRGGAVRGGSDLHSGGRALGLGDEE